MAHNAQGESVIAASDLFSDSSQLMSAKSMLPPILVFFSYTFAVTYCSCREEKYQRHLLYQLKTM